MTPDIIFPRIENLVQKINSLHNHMVTADKEDELTRALYGLEALYGHIANNTQIFGYEMWYPLLDSHYSNSNGQGAGNDGTDNPVEMLLRLKDSKGDDISPYPVIMAMYNNGLAEDIDTILFLCALRQFKMINYKLVSINISARSLLSSDFIKTILPALETMRLETNGKKEVIIEIHESAPTLVMSKHILSMFHRFGAHFAIDDVGLSLNDVFRFSEFDGIANYIKIDRHMVCSPPDSENSLPCVISFIKSILPDSVLVAEGVESVEQAYDLHRQYPQLDYVQGKFLPKPEEFKQLWNNIRVNVRQSSI